MTSLVVRLAGPMQSWGTRSEFNRRDTDAEPSKSGVTGMLAAAHGRRRSDPIEDLLRLRLGVRLDQPGTLMRDFHTVSDYTGAPLPKADVDRRGRMRRTSPAKHIAVTHRLYIQDAVFVVALEGPDDVLRGTADALVAPSFPLALGRRSCPPTPPLVLKAHDDEPLWDGGLMNVLQQVPWQATSQRLLAADAAPTVSATLDDPEGDEVRYDVPISFSPERRGFTSRRVRQVWIAIPRRTDGGTSVSHDPMTLLGG